MRPSDLLTNLARYWARVDRTGECWLWTGAKNNKGYGRFDLWHDGKQSRLLAHRLVLLIHGQDLTSDQVVMHLCDNPPCVNPSHLRVGTQRENIRDALAKGRLDLTGLEVGQRLTAPELAEIRRRKPRVAS